MRRSFQFSLRALLVAVLGVVCFFAGIRFDRELERHRRKAIYSSDLDIPFPCGSFSNFIETGDPTPDPPESARQE